MPACAPATCSFRRPWRIVGSLAAGGVLAALLAAGCSSGTNPGTSPTVPERSTTTTAAVTTTAAQQPASTTTIPATTTSQRATTTTTTGGSTTTTRADATTTSTNSATTTSAERPTTTTSGPATTSTTVATATSTTPTTTRATTTTTGVDSALVDSKQKDVPWLAIGALVAVAVMVLVLALRSRSQRATWWQRADALTREGRAVIDLGTAAPVGADPQQEIAHWATIEQRTESFGEELTALAAHGVPDDATRAALAGLGVATNDYLAALRTSRTLRIGPPAPTPEQLQYADAESAQRLAIVRASLDQVDQLVLPHRTTA